MSYILLDFVLLVCLTLPFGASNRLWSFAADVGLGICPINYILRLSLRVESPLVCVVVVWAAAGDEAVSFGAAELLVSTIYCFYRCDARLCVRVTEVVDSILCVFATETNCMNSKSSRLNESLVHYNNVAIDHDFN